MRGNLGRNRPVRPGPGGTGTLVATLGIVALGWLDPGGNSVSPRLNVTRLTHRELQLTITNATGTNTYELLHRPTLDPRDAWRLAQIGTNGQSHFVVPMAVDLTGFFGARAGLDDDGDGSNNLIDANPTNAAVGTLRVTIVYPGAGSTVP